MTEELLREHRPDAAPMDAAARRHSRAVLAEAIRREHRTVRRPHLRLLPAGGVVAAVAMALVVGVGLPRDASYESNTSPWLLRPQPAGALTEVRPDQDGMVEIRFLHPDADPERIMAELSEHGFALNVTFVPTDPFLIGSMVASTTPDGAMPVETLEEGTDVTGGGVGQLVGIRVPRGWTGTGHAITLGRPALDDEPFITTAAVNAERPGGPLHCAGVHGMRPDEAEDVVTALGYRVQWRTQKAGAGGMTTTIERPPASFYVEESVWYSPEEIILFADPRSPQPRSSEIQELLSRGCDSAAGQ